MLVRLKSGEVAVRVPDAGPSSTPVPIDVDKAKRAHKKKRSKVPKVPPPSSPTATPEELAELEKHVWYGCFICVIYLPRNMARCNETIENIVAHGFPAPYMIPGVTPRPGDTVHDCVCRAHHNAVGWFLSKGLDARYNLLVLEDDARFTIADSADRLAAALDSLESWGKWGSLHVGHVPMGPIYPLPNGLVRTVNPATSHCYVLNRRSVRSIFALVPERLWKRPMMVEGHWAYPADERFAMSPTLATQCVMPKEMAAMPIIRDHFSFDDGQRTAVCFAYFQTVALAVLLLWAVLATAHYPLDLLARAQLDADEDNMPPCTLVRERLSVALAAWLTVTALLLHATYYFLRRFTCALAERRHWRTYLLDASRTGLGLAVASAFEFGFVTRIPPSARAQEQAAADGVDELSRAAAVLLVAPLFAWPLALVLHHLATSVAARHRRLQVRGAPSGPRPSNSLDPHATVPPLTLRPCLPRWHAPCHCCATVLRRCCAPLCPSAPCAAVRVGEWQVRGPPLPHARRRGGGGGGAGGGARAGACRHRQRRSRGGPPPARANPQGAERLLPARALAAAGGAVPVARGVLPLPGGAGAPGAAAAARRRLSRARRHGRRLRLRLQRRALRRGQL
jgi:hypothetical protein